MLEIYEGRDSDRKSVRKIQGESLEIRMVRGYLIWLELRVEGKTILSLYVSPHQMSRLGKYLADGRWRGGAICPRKTEPKGCDIVELNDRARYLQVLSQIERHKATIREYEAKDWKSNWYQKQLSNLEIEALMLKDSARFGLIFQFVMTEPDTEIEWLPEDRESEAKKFLEAVRSAYDMREPDELTKKTDLTDWKRKLFDEEAE